MIALVRHGQSTTNAEGLLVGRSDPHLTELGERQARALAPWLNDVSEVWVSPLARARETAALAMPGRRTVVKDAFIELDYGTLEGQSAATMAGENWRALELAHETRFGDGESLAAVDERVRAELEVLFADESSLLHSSSEHLAIVSHVSPIKAAVAWALGVPGSIAWRMRLENGSLTMVGARGHTPQLIRFNVVPALI
ncbi:MAG: histidine phosphatase family protein [Acidimicrobiales bacterium]